MKISFPVLSSSLFLMAAPPFFATTEAAPAMRDEYFLGAADDIPMDATPVIVKVHCVGIDLAAATISMGGYAGSILEQTYAVVHPTSDMDDSSLTSLVFHGHGGGAMTTINIIQKDDLAFDDKADAETTDVQPTDGDAADHNHKNIIERTKTTPAVYTALWNCGYACPEDVKGLTKKAWEAGFVSDLVGSGMQFFAPIKSCTIDLELAPYENENANAALNVKCKGVKIKHPTVAEATYTAHALEASYNKVHDHHMGDTESMSHASFNVPGSTALVAQYHGNRTDDGHDEEGLGQYSYYDIYWAAIQASINAGESGYPKPYDDDQPGYCWDDDDDVTWWTKGKSDPDFLGAYGVQKWEEQFSKYLRESEFSNFHKVHSCGITVDVEASSSLLSALRRQHHQPPSEHGDEYDDEEEHEAEQNLRGMKAPQRAPVRPPARTPVKSPVRVPVRAPVKTPVRQPVRVPVRVPVRAPTRPSPPKPTKYPLRTDSRGCNIFPSAKDPKPKLVDEEENNKENMDTNNNEKKGLKGSSSSSSSSSSSTMTPGPTNPLGTVAQDA